MVVVVKAPEREIFDSLDGAFLFIIKISNMNQEVKKKWLEALRSGQYRQAQEALRVDSISPDGEGCISSFCCLGVLCDLYAKEQPQYARWNAEEFCYTQEEENFDDRLDTVTTILVEKCETAMLPRTVRAWADIETGEARVPKEVKTPSGYMTWTLAGANDAGLTFEQIANIIEEQL